MVIAKKTKMILNLYYLPDDYDISAIIKGTELRKGKKSDNEE